MAADLQHPERVVGFHFFNPVSVMPLLEVIPGQKTDEATLATAFATGRTLGKTCILAGDAPSFVANRLLGRLMSDAFKILDEGTPVEVVDQAFAGIAPMPLYVLLGLVGPAIALHNSETLKGAFPDRFYVSENLRKVVEAGKSGYYIYPEGKPQMDPEVTALLSTPDNPVVLTAEQVREEVLGGSGRRGPAHARRPGRPSPDGRRPRDDHRCRVLLLERWAHPAPGPQRRVPGARRGTLPAAWGGERSRLTNPSGGMPGARHPAYR